MVVGALLAGAMVLCSACALAQKAPVNATRIDRETLDIAIEPIKDLQSRVTLRKGMSGAEVSQLQQNLKTLGFFTDNTITGYFGDSTEYAVQRFQMMYGLTVDGVVGDTTQAAIQRALLQQGTQTQPTQPGTGSVNDFLVDTTKTLKYGSRSTAVTRLQNALKVLGFYPANDVATGYYGYTTTTAVQAFQQRYGLTVDGIAGRNTLTAINNLLMSITLNLDPITFNPAVVGSAYTVSLGGFVRGGLGSISYQTTIYLNGYQITSSNLSDFQFVPTTEGIDMVRVVVSDQAGHTATQDAQLQVVTPVPITVSASVASVGPIGYPINTYVSVSGGVTQNFSYNYYLISDSYAVTQMLSGQQSSVGSFTIDQQGAYCVYVEVTDGYTTSSVYTNWFSVIPYSGLSATVSEITTAPIVGGAPVTLTVSAYSNVAQGFAYNYYLINDQFSFVEQKMGVYENTVSFNITQLGNYVILVEVTDGYQSISGLYSNWFTAVSAQPLSVTVTTPTSAYLGQPFSAQTTVSGGYGNNVFNYYLYDSNFQIIDSILGTTQTSATFTVHNAGIYMVYAQVTDGYMTTAANSEWFAALPSANKLMINSVMLDKSVYNPGEVATVKASVSGGVGQYYVMTYYVSDSMSRIVSQSVSTQNMLQWTFNAPSTPGAYVVLVVVWDGVDSATGYSGWFTVSSTGTIMEDEEPEEDIPPVIDETPESVEVVTPEQPELPAQPEQVVDQMPAQDMPPVLDLDPEPVTVATPDA